MIKPLDTEQTSTDTQKELKDKIDLKDLVVGVESIKNIRKGGIIINMANAESKTILKNKVKEDMGNKYQVEDAKFKNPEIIVVGAEKEIVGKEDEEILECIMEQNELKNISDNIHNELNVKRKYVNKNRTNSMSIILEVNSGVFSKIIEFGTLCVGRRECKIFNHVKVVRCYICLRFNHFSDECKNEKTCARCAGNHDTKQCGVEEGDKNVPTALIQWKR